MKKLQEPWRASDRLYLWTLFSTDPDLMKEDRSLDKFESAAPACSRLRWFHRQRMLVVMGVAAESGHVRRPDNAAMENT